MKIFDDLVDLLLPPVCPICEVPLAQAGLCAPCGSAIACRAAVLCPTCLEPYLERSSKPLLFPLSSAEEGGEGKRARREAPRCTCTEQSSSILGSIRAIGVYSETLGSLLRRAKFCGRPRLIDPLVPLLLRFGLPVARRATLVVPVPPSPDSPLEDHLATRLARQLARRWQIPLAEDLVRRLPGRPPQRKLDFYSRRRNLDGAFRLGKPKALRGHRLLLVDDICTTGTTLRVLAELCLTDTDALSADAIVLARQPLLMRSKKFFSSHIA